MMLSSLARAAGLPHDGPDVDVSGIAHDARRVRPGELFVALPGTRVDGARFVGDAVARGAAAVCVAAGAEVPRDAGVPVLRTDDPRAALSRLSAAFHGEPARELRLIGITGTLGKTSTALLVQTALAATDARSADGGTGIGVIGSLGARVRGPASARIGTGALPDTDGMTTPDPPVLHRALRTMADAGVRTVAMEVTSHALAQRRVEGLRYALGVLTNLVPDEHLDFHGTPEAYLRTKVRFFDHLEPGAPLVADADDPLVREHVAAFVARDPHPVIDVSLGAIAAALHDGAPPARDPAVCVEALQWDAGGATFGLRVRRPIPRLRALRGAPAGADDRIEPCTVPIVLPVLGVQQVANAALAATAAMIAGASEEGITEALAELEPIRRRMEVVRAARPLVVDDTAGNPLTLRAVFASADALPHRALHVAYGLRGLRGPEINRRLAATLARLVAERRARVPVTLVVTSSEDAADARNRVQPDERAAALAELDAAGVAYAFEPTLAAAVARTIDAAGDDDLVLLLGAQGMDRAAETARARLAGRDA